MARGWESKSVEDQMELAEARRAERSASVNGMTPAQAELLRQREALELQLTRMRQEYEASQHPRHQLQLQEGIRFLEAKLAELG
jgi:hypothetical protein